MSEYFKTKAVTELTFLNLKGKKYLQVAHRLVWLREEHPDAIIQTEAITVTSSFAVFKASVTINGKIVATGHGSENIKTFPSFLEKAETKAVGRALAMAGYGTQFAPDLDEEEMLVDSPIQTKAPQAANPSQSVSIVGQENLRAAQGKPDTLKAKSVKAMTPNSGNNYDFDLKGDQFGPHSGKKLSQLSSAELRGFLEDFEGFKWASPAQEKYAKRVAKTLLDTVSSTP